jgi:hypothetical protein
VTLNIVRLTRLTTEYVPAEDRMRLAGETAPDQAVVIWITRRLLDRVLPHLFGWLERKGPAVPQASIATGLGELVQGMAQQSARAALPVQPPVNAARASRSWLVSSIDVTTEESLVRLTFAAPPGEEAVSIDLAINPLRQWLNIVHDRYRQAEWPMQGWPAWMTETAAQPAGAAPAVLH